MGSNTLTRAVRGALYAGVTASALALAACGGSGGGGGGDGSGTLSLGLTDAPVDNATAVVVEFGSVTLKPADSEPFTIDFDTPKSIDLLKQQDGNSKLLLENQEVTAGDYDWIRLGVNEGANKTFIDIDGGKNKLDVPSGQNTGLKLVSGFTVGDSDDVDLTIDFDLRKSVIQTGNGYKLRPALRLVNSTDTGEIDVSVTETYQSNNQCGTAPMKQAVYVFEGDGVTPDDIDGNSPEPITTVELTDDDDDPAFEGTAGFLEPGTYTVAYTCNPEDDDPETDDALTFIDAVDRDVQAGETATYDLPLPN